MKTKTRRYEYKRNINWNLGDKKIDTQKSIAIVTVGWTQLNRELL